MRLLGRLFRTTSGSKVDAIHLDVTNPYWEVSGDAGFPELIAALPDLLPSGCVLYFENASPSGELAEFLQQRQLSEPTYVEPGSWPWPKALHIPATSETMLRLSELSRTCAAPELAIHFHVYRERTTLLEWHDVFDQPMLLSGEFPEEKVRTFAERLHMSYNRAEQWLATDGALRPR